MLFRLAVSRHVLAARLTDFARIHHDLIVAVGFCDLLSGVDRYRLHPSGPSYWPNHTNPRKSTWDMKSSERNTIGFMCCGILEGFHVGVYDSCSSRSSSSIFSPASVMAKCFSPRYVAQPLATA